MGSTIEEEIIKTKFPIPIINLIIILVLILSALANIYLYKNYDKVEGTTNNHIRR